MSFFYLYNYNQSGVDLGEANEAVASDPLFLEMP